MRVFEPLLHWHYALFWWSDLVASVGQFVREVALYWLAYENTGSAIALGVLGFCEATPRLLLGAVGRVIVDQDRLRFYVDHAARIVEPLNGVSNGALNIPFAIF